MQAVKRRRYAQGGALLVREPHGSVAYRIPAEFRAEIGEEKTVEKYERLLRLRVPLFVTRSCSWRIISPSVKHQISVPGWASHRQDHGPDWHSCLATFSGLRNCLDIGCINFYRSGPHDEIHQQHKAEAILLANHYSFSSTKGPFHDPDSSAHSQVRMG